VSDAPPAREEAQEAAGIARAAGFAGLGHDGTLSPGAAGELDAAITTDPDPRVRAAALAARVRGSHGPENDPSSVWSTAAHDPAAPVRRRAAEVAPQLVAHQPGSGRATRRSEIAERLVDLLADDEITVVTAAAWALGELGPGEAGTEVTALAAAATGHEDPLAREAAVAALGAIGDPAAVPAVLAGCRDRVTVRRRAVLALAPFDGPEVRAALQAALDDRDWQVRQAAEDLLEGAPEEGAAD